MPEPAPPGPAELVLQVHTAPVTFATTLIAKGSYQYRPDPPFTLGIECSAIVEKVGSVVTTFAPGDPVMVIGLQSSPGNEFRIAGTFAEKVVVDMDCVRLVPPGLDIEAAAFFRSSYETAAYALHVGGLKPGERLLVMGAGGGAGFAAVTIGKAMGAVVLASASTQARRDLARLAGADIVLDSAASDWREQVGDLTQGHGVDIIFDPVGGDATERAFRSLAFGGRHVVVGFAAGSIPRLPLNLALMKGACVVGANHLRATRETPEITAISSGKVWKMLNAGLLVLPSVAKRFTIEQVTEALATVETGVLAGRVVISMSGNGDRSNNAATAGGERQPIQCGSV